MNNADQFTRRLLRDGRIGRGQRVLDVGCGAGAVTSMILDLIGDNGQVIGSTGMPRRSSLRAGNRIWRAGIGRLTTIRALPFPATVLFSRQRSFCSAISRFRTRDAVEETRFELA